MMYYNVGSSCCCCRKSRWWACNFLLGKVAGKILVDTNICRTNIIKHPNAENKTIGSVVSIPQNWPSFHMK